MPIYLPRPPHDPRGPDGKGWNRIGLYNADLSADECALRPRSYGALWESQDTRRATYGVYGPCTRQGQCDGCPVLAAIVNGPAPPLRPAGVDRVLVRVKSRPAFPDALFDQCMIHTPHLMDDPEQGWHSASTPTTWDRLSHALGHGWTLGRRHVDDDSPGVGEAFWLHRALCKSG